MILPRLNRDLCQFCDQWNNHPLRTEHNHTPTQLHNIISFLVHHILEESVVYDICMLTMMIMKRLCTLIFQIQ